MPDDIDMTGSIAEALATAMDRERPATIGVVEPDGAPAVTFRGSLYVHTPSQLALWARKRDSGFAVDVVENPRVTVLYYDPDQGPDPAVGVRRAIIKGTARVVPELNDAVYSAIPAVERDRDPERVGVAVLIDVDYVNAFGGMGPVKQGRAVGEPSPFSGNGGGPRGPRGG